MSEIIEEVKPLTLVERNNLQYHEQRVEKGIGSMMEMADSLRAIRDGRLFRETHAYFKDYTADRFGMTRNNIDQIIWAHEVFTQLEEVSDEKPAFRMSVGVGQELRPLDADERLRVIQEADRRGGVTRQNIREIKSEIKSEIKAGAQQPRPSIAMQQAALAIAELTKVPFNDPLATDAFKKVINFCQGRLI